MKTVLFTSCYLDGKDAQGNDRLERTKRYIKYYGSIKDILGIDECFLLDNGSSEENIGKLKEFLFSGRTHGQFDVKFKSVVNVEHGRPGIPLDYRHCWRSLYYYKQLIEENYKKIICIDTDTFVISTQLAEYIKNLKEEYTTFWSRKYQFPTAELTVLCENKFPRMLKFLETPMEQKFGLLMEQNLPFTCVNVEYNVDRFGETGAPIEANMDGYSQARPEFVPELK